MSRRRVLAGVAAAAAVPASARAQAAFKEHDPAADPARLLAFLAANDGGLVRLDIRLPLSSGIDGLSYAFLRNERFLVLIDRRGWRARGAMFFVGDDGVRQSDHFALDRLYQVSRNRSFKGPSFKDVDDLPWLFAGYHVDPFG